MLALWHGKFATKFKIMDRTILIDGRKWSVEEGLDEQHLIVRWKGYSGICDPHGDWIIQPCFCDIETYDEGVNIYLAQRGEGFHPGPSVFDQNCKLVYFDSKCQPDEIWVAKYQGNPAFLCHFYWDEIYEGYFSLLGSRLSPLTIIPSYEVSDNSSINS